MAIKFIGIRKRFRRARLNRRPRRQFYGEKGWLWQEIIMSNTFTTVDNSQSTSEVVFSGSQFTESNVGGANTKTVVLRRVIAQLYVTTVQPDFQLYPMTQVDVGLLHVKQTSSPTDLFPNLDTTNSTLEFTQEAGRARVLAHERLWTMGAWNERPLGEDPPTVFSTLQGKNSVYFDFRPNLPLDDFASLQVMISQCGAELYTNETDFLVSGYCKAFLQKK